MIDGLPATSALPWLAQVGGCNYVVQFGRPHPHRSACPIGTADMIVRNFDPCIRRSMSARPQSLFAAEQRLGSGTDAAPDLPALAPRRCTAKLRLVPRSARRGPERAGCCVLASRRRRGVPLVCATGGPSMRERPLRLRSTVAGARFSIIVPRSRDRSSRGGPLPKGHAYRQRGSRTRLRRPRPATLGDGHDAMQALARRRAGMAHGGVRGGVITAASRSRSIERVEHAASCCVARPCRSLGPDGDRGRTRTACRRTAGHAACCPRSTRGQAGRVHRCSPTAPQRPRTTTNQFCRPRESPRWPFQPGTEG